MLSQAVWDWTLGARVAALIAEVVNEDTQNAISTGDTGIDFVLDPSTVRSFRSDKHSGHCRSVKAVVDESFESCVALQPGALPQGGILKACRRRALDDVVVPDLVHAPDVPLIVETEEDSPCHFRRPLRPEELRPEPSLR